MKEEFKYILLLVLIFGLPFLGELIRKGVIF